MELFWRPMALEDRSAIMDFIASDNPAAAIEIDECFENAATELCLNPKMYKTGRVVGTREAVIHRNYIIVDRIFGAKIEILRVLHAAQKWPK